MTNRVTKLTQAANLNENQQAKVRTIYNVQLGGIQNAADALYAASQKAGASVADLEKSLEDKRESMKRAVEGVLRPEQLENIKAWMIRFPARIGYLAMKSITVRHRAAFHLDRKGMQ